MALTQKSNYLLTQKWTASDDFPSEAVLQTRKPDPVLAHHLSTQPTHQERASSP
jgi:hypothetical protein